MMNFYQNLINVGSFKDVAKFCHYSRATLFRYYERFKRIGITEQSIKPINTSYELPKAPLDLREYQILISDTALLRSIKIGEAR